MKVIIVGGVAGGASCAARLRRLDEKAEIVVLERSGHVSFANCGLPYHLSDEIPQRASLLLHTPASLKRRYGLDVRTGHEVLSIDPRAHRIEGCNAQGEHFEMAYDKLVLATGAAPIRPPLPGIERAQTLRNIEDLDQLKYLQAQHPNGAFVVVGAGFIGLEAAENLHRAGHAVTVVEKAPQVLPPLDAEMAAWVENEVRRQGVGLHLNSELVGLEAEHAVLADGTRLPAQAVLLAIGVRPENQLARQAGLELGATGGILVNDRLQTSAPDIYAVGDAVEKIHGVGRDQGLVPLAWSANRQGRLLADHLAGLPIHWGSVVGTAIVKVFGLTAAVVGRNERQLQALGQPFQAAWIHPGSHAGYYPGATPLHMKLLFDPESRKMLGAQVVGEQGVDKQIDVLAMALQRGVTAAKLAELELAYAPPYGSAKSPVNLLGYVAENMLTGRVKTCRWDALAGLSDTHTLIDVRTPAEYAQGHLPGAQNWPLDSLRDHLAALPQGPLLVYCQVGLRGYLAARLLMQHGREVCNLNGGLSTWSVWPEHQAALQETRRVLALAHP
ncbi:MAG: FAD-dependent oxidoreductase [Candidatus Sericytochromatia bacterium]